ncbi:MAG: helix-turn-helix domain-containing protein [Pseudomonadota bacterium]
MANSSSSPRVCEGPEADLHAVLPRELAWRAAHIADACSGAEMIAELDLLEGETATARWSCRETFRRRHPRADFRPDRALAFAGDGDRVVTSGGMAGWSDLALYLVARILGPVHASHASRFYCVDPRAEDQCRYAAMSRHAQCDDAVIRDCQLWVADGHADAAAVAAMLRRSGLPRQSFDRCVRAATGYSPRGFVQALRMEEAKQPLEATRAPIEAVADAIGYADPRAFQRQFHRATRLIPSAYRRRFSHDSFLAHR